MILEMKIFLHPRLSSILERVGNMQKAAEWLDQSVLSELEDASHGIQDWARSHGSLPLQGFRCNDYNSSPPTWGDSSDFSRRVYRRWDRRSSAWSDEDSGSQSDLDSAGE